MYSDASASEILQSHQEVQKLKEQDALEKTKAQPKPAPAKAYASNLVSVLSNDLSQLFDD